MGGAGWQVAALRPLASWRGGLVRRGGGTFAWGAVGIQQKSFRRTNGDECTGTGTKGCPILGIMTLQVCKAVCKLSTAV